MVYEKVFSIRGAEGELNFDMLVRVAQLEGCSDEETVEIIKQASIVEPLVLKHRYDLIEQKRKTDQQNGK